MDRLRKKESKKKKFEMDNEQFEKERKKEIKKLKYVHTSWTDRGKRNLPEKAVILIQLF